MTPASGGVLGVAEVLGPVPHAPFRRLLAFILRRPLVLLIDHDGETNVRVAWRDAFGRWCAHRMGFGIRDVLLLDGGKVGNGCYCARWIGLNARSAAEAARAGEA